MVQAHRIKTESPAIRAGILRFVNGVVREIGFWLLVATALWMIVALASFNATDAAWTHTANVTQIHNFGGKVGAWFADVLLYFFGYSAYLLPLGIAFSGWRLFKRGALMELDAEIVLFRVLGFAVTLIMASGLAALHLHATPGNIPGVVGSAGGLVGLHVSQFLTQAFKFLGGDIFMIALFLAGLTLTTGLSWLALLDGIGSMALAVIDWVGSTIMTPVHRRRPTVTAARNALGAAANDAAAASSSSSTKPPVSDPAAGRGQLALGQWLKRTAERPLAWWRTRRAVSVVPAEPTAGGKEPSQSVSPAIELAPVATAELLSVAPSGRPAARIEPVLNLPLADGPAPHPESPTPTSGTSSVAAQARPPVMPDMLTLVPTAAPVMAGNQPATPLPVMTAVTAPAPPPATASAPAVSVQVPWTPLNNFSATASNDPLAVAPPPPPASPILQAAPALADFDEDDADETEPYPVRFPLDLTVVPRVASPPISATPVSVAPVASMVQRVTAPPASAPYPLPSLNLLDRPSPRTAGYSQEKLDEMSRQLEILLKHFGIEVRVVAVEPGPVITRFEIEPAPGVKVSQISNLAKDLARGLSVISVRVVEIIPGKSVVGLEIPNQHREIVYLREVLEAPVYSQAASPLTLTLGKDIGGNPVVANLVKMPHLLVAGTTGSGKSVAINAMLLSLLYKASPSEVRLILVDPKMLELSMYEDIPHLLTPVVTDMKEAANALRWCVGEMERRYRLMAAEKVRNIAGFNHKIADALVRGERIPDPLWKLGDGVPGEVPALTPLPCIVVVIDELADMMMIVGKKVEELIARLAQKARAAGIHLILATQRPSVDVITGLIKANIPTRVAFQVSSRVDSRTILDQMGAEQLLGHGDMLYLPPGTGLPQRVHGAFVDDQEVIRVVEYLRQTGAPSYIDAVLAEPREESEGAEEADNGGRGGETDPLYDEAVRIVTESRRASVSGVQRRLRIGYNRAARMIEEMEAAGVIGPLQSNGNREVLAPPPP
ncbi:MAG: DNA translocase FtsK 4TM domain-containing protein [Candidatus Competibacteraceae bacterium]